MNTNTTEQADILISHVVDGESTAEQWRELEALAVMEPRLWRDLAAAQRDAAALRSAMRVAGDAADRVGLPASAHAPNERDSYDIHAYAHPQLRLNRFGAWTGWLVAAMVTIVATISYQTNRGIGTTGDAAGIGAAVLPASSSQLFDQYLTAGQKDGSVLGEVPGKMLVESRPAPKGEGFEVIYVRQVVERAIVPDLYKIDGTDDRGQATLARYRQPVRRTM